MISGGLKAKIIKETKIKFFGNGDDDLKDTVHFVMKNGGDFTLCGLTLDGDRITCGDYYKTKENVNCNNCRKIVDYCRSIKRNW